MVENSSFKRKRIIRQSIILLVIGLLITAIGLYTLFFKEPVVFINSYRNQLTVSDGSLELLIGLGFIIGSLMRYLYRNENEEKKNHEKRKNWLKHH